ncbi:DUF5010 domain-containing protein, partial [bacterium]|nr:DUF5010 domain-containing protein [bacterium]
EYPSQRLNILRSYSQNPYPVTYKLEAEACDDYSDNTTGNSGGTFLHLGDLDVAKSSDLRGGWHVTATQAGEWLQWRDIPLLANSKFQLRYKSTAVSSINIEVAGSAIATTSLPSTNGLWSTIDVGTYSWPANIVRTVRLNIDLGSPDINYLTRTAVSSNTVSSVSISPSVYTLAKDETHEFSASVSPSNADNKSVNWVSDNPKVAIVNGVGKVTAINPGTAKIWAITHDGEKTSSATVTVTGTLYLDECDLTTGWTSSQSLTLNTTDKQQNTGCIEFTGSTTDEFKKVFSPAFNSGTTLANGALRFWYYVSDVTKCGPVRVELGSGGRADVNEYSWQLTGLTNGWNQASLRMNASTKVGTCDLSAINWFRIYDSKSGSITTRIDGIEVYNADLSALNELKMNEMEVSIYPNPAKDQINIKLSETNISKLNFTLFDVSGNAILQKGHDQLNSQDYSFNVKTLKSGIYLLNITSNKGCITKKVTIIR